MFYNKVFYLTERANEKKFIARVIADTHISFFCYGKCFVDQKYENYSLIFQKEGIKGYFQALLFATKYL